MRETGGLELVVRWKFLREKDCYQCPPFPWTLEFGFVTIQRAQNYIRAIHPCIVFWRSNKFLVGVFAKQSSHFRDFADINKNWRPLHKLFSDSQTPNRNRYLTFNIYH